MSEPARVLVSVRGEARLTVPPDSAVIAAALSTSAGSRAGAVQAAAAALDGLTGDLAGLGGVPLGTNTLRRPLTWSARSAATRDEYVHDKTTGESQPTGQITATVAMQITVRDFGLLDVVGTHLAGHAALTVHEVSWHADWDNPGWRQVRAAAIAAAIAKGRDYAAALGGQLAAAEHIADPGLIGSDGQHWAATSRSARSFASSDTRGAPSLDPVPQELTAVIEARFTATGITLASETNTI
jgi:uncharacterized protein YggE